MDRPTSPPRPDLEKEDEQSEVQHKNSHDTGCENDCDNTYADNTHVHVDSPSSPPEKEDTHNTLQVVKNSYDIKCAKDSKKIICIIKAKNNDKDLDMKPLELKNSLHTVKTKEEAAKSEGFPDKLEWELSSTHHAPDHEQMSYSTDAVTHEGILYFRQYQRKKIYSYNDSAAQWATIPECRVKDTTLAIIPVKEGSGTCHYPLHTVGGINEATDHQSDNEIFTDRLYQLQRKQSDKLEWIDSPYSPMKTKRSQATAVCDEKWLIVAGGRSDCGPTATVEVLLIDSNVWITVADLPRPLFRASGCLCNGDLYILGGHIKDSDTIGYSKPITSAFKASVADIVKTHAAPSETQVFNKIENLPLYDSACISTCGHILAIGGSAFDRNSNEQRSSSLVHAYHPEDKTWKKLPNSLNVPRTRCFAAALPSQLMVVGGLTRTPDIGPTNSVECAPFK